MRLTSRLLVGLAATTVLSGVAAPGIAQTKDAGGTPTAASDPTNGDIIVTATKRAETLQNVPIAITALTPEVLEQRQVSSFDDIAKLVPSVSYQSFGPGGAQLYFRGIATAGDGLAIGSLPTAGLYIDETPVTTIAQSVDIHAYDLARVEALAGPQGTLYGASSLAGTLRIITNKPSTAGWDGGMDAEINKFGAGDVGGTLEGFVNVPISDRVALRVVGFYEKKGGYIDNTPATRTYLRPQTVTVDDGEGGETTTTVNHPLTVNNADLAEDDYNDVTTFGGRAALGIDLDDTWTANLSGIYQHQRSHGEFIYDPRAGDLENHDFVPSNNRDDFGIGSLTVQGKLSDWDVTFNASYFKRVVETTADYSYFTVAYDSYPDYNYLYDAAGNDIDPTQIFRGYDHYSKWSSELRVSSPADYRVRLTAGLFAQHQIDDRIADYILPGVSTAVAPFSPPVPGAGPDDVYFTDIHRVDRDYAVFGEVSFDILPNLTLLAGIRGFMADNTIAGFSGSLGALQRQQTVFGCTGTTTQECPNTDKRYVESGETHKVNLTWKVDPTHLLYATYSTGFRPGGNNRDAFALGRLQIIPAYKADTVTNYEIGAKTEWLDRRLRINGALFWEDWNNVQYALPGVLGIFYTLNAGTARSRGVEGDLSWRVATPLTLSVSGTYVDPQLTTDFVGTDGVVQAPKGTRLPVTPNVKLTGVARFDTALGGNKAFVQGAINYQSNTTQSLSTDTANALGKLAGFVTADFSAGYRWGQFSLEAFIQNAFDKRGIIGSSYFCSFCYSTARLFPTKPRFFGLKLGTRFK